MALEAQVSNWTDVLSATFSRSIDAHLVIILTHSSESLKHGIHLWWTGGGGPTSLPPPCEMGVARQFGCASNQPPCMLKFLWDFSFANFVKEGAFSKVKCEYVVSGVQWVQLTRAFAKWKHESPNIEMTSNVQKNILYILYQPSPETATVRTL